MNTLKYKYGFFILFIFYLSLSNPAIGQEVEITTIYLIRHAEKADDGTSDPPLSDKGQIRAKNLAFLLQDVEVDAIYSTNYKRTMETVDELSENKNIPVTRYNPGDPAMVESILSAYGGGNVVIVGHSNTVPATVNQLIGYNQFNQLPESEYDKLFLVNLVKIGEGKVQILRY